MRDKIIKEGEKAGFEFSNQALDILLKTAKPLENAKELIKLAEERKFKIAGGDVARFIIRGDLPKAQVNSEDIR